MPCSLLRLCKATHFSLSLITKTLTYTPCSVVTQPLIINIVLYCSHPSVRRLSRQDAHQGCSQWTALCIYLNWKFTISSHSRSSLRTVKWVFEENLTVKCSCRVVFPPGVRTPLPSSPLLLFFSCVQALFSWGRCSWPTCIRSSLCVCRVWFLLSSSHNIGKKTCARAAKTAAESPIL